MNDHDDDLLLLSRLKNGDIKAYEQVFSKYYHALNVEAYYLLKDEMEAEDQVQTLFIELWDKQYYQNINGSLKSYLHTAIRNRCLCQIKKGRNRQKRLDDYVDTLEDRTEGNVTELQESEKKLYQILAELPNQRLQAFSLVYLEDKKYKEAAVEMGITINSVKTHLKLAVKVLQRKLIKYK